MKRRSPVSISVDAIEICCRQCSVVKPVEYFLQDKRRASGRRNLCKKCHASNEKTRRNLDPEFKRIQRSRNLKSAYGITVDEWDMIFLSQNLVCIICQTETPVGVGKWHTDHCHKCNKIRGILCSTCNMVLGNIEKGWSLRIPEFVRYLEVHIHAMDDQKIK